MEDKRMNFYYNLGENLCAEEDWVVDYLVNNGEVETRGRGTHWSSFL